MVSRKSQGNQTPHGWNEPEVAVRFGRSRLGAFRGLPGHGAPGGAGRSGEAGAAERGAARRGFRRAASSFVLL